MKEWVHSRCDVVVRRALGNALVVDGFVLRPGRHRGVRGVNIYGISSIYHVGLISLGSSKC